MNMLKRDIDAIRTVGQLLLHNPTTGASARDAQGDPVSPLNTSACCFCYTGAACFVAEYTGISWLRLDRICADVLVGRSDSLVPQDWDEAGNKQRKAWAQKLADFEG